MGHVKHSAAATQLHLATTRSVFKQRTLLENETKHPSNPTLNEQCWRRTFTLLTSGTVHICVWFRFRCCCVMSSLSDVVHVMCLFAYVHVVHLSQVTTWGCVLLLQRKTWDTFIRSACLHIWWLYILYTCFMLHHTNRPFCFVMMEWRPLCKLKF